MEEAPAQATPKGTAGRSDAPHPAELVAEVVATAGPGKPEQEEQPKNDTGSPAAGQTTTESLQQPSVEAEDDDAGLEDAVLVADMATPAATTEQAVENSSGSAAALDAAAAMLVANTIALLGLDDVTTLQKGAAQPLPAEPLLAAAGEVEATAMLLLPAASSTDEASDAAVGSEDDAALEAEESTEAAAIQEAETEEAPELGKAAMAAFCSSEGVESGDAADEGTADLPAVAHQLPGLAALAMLPDSSSIWTDEQPAAEPKVEAVQGDAAEEEAQAASPPLAAELEQAPSPPPATAEVITADAVEAGADVGPELPAWEQGQGMAATVALESAASAALEGVPPGLALADPAVGDGEPDAPAYSAAEIFQREVSAKLLEVLSQEQLQEQEAGGAAGEGSEAARAAAPPPLHVLAGAAEPCEPGAASDATAPGLKWAPPTKQNSPYRRKVCGAIATSASPTQLSSPAGQSGSHSPTHRHRMAPMGSIKPQCTHSPPAAPAARSSPTRMPPLNRTAPKAAAGTRGAAAPPVRRLSKPSMTEILAAASGKASRPAAARARSGALEQQLRTAAPPAVGQAPYLLPGTGAALPAFPSLAAVPSDRLLHWSRRAAGGGATPALPPPGWFMGVPPPGAGFPVFLPGMALLPGMPPPGFMAPGPDGSPLPATSSSSALVGEAADGMAAEAAEGREEATGNTANAAAPDAQPAEMRGEGSSSEQQEGAATAEEGAHLYAPSAGQPEAASLPMPVAGRVQEQAIEVAASWPPYEGAKLPPLYQDQVNATAGLMPVVHSAASFSVAATRRTAPMRPSGQAWLAQQAPPGYSAVAPPGAWMVPGHAEMMAPQQWAGYAGLAEEQQKVLYYQQCQAFYQQQQYQQLQQQQYYQQTQQQQDLHPDEPHFVREPIPQVPVALDPSGRPFKVFHGVAARGIRRPERYQGDGRPAWSVK